MKVLSLGLEEYSPTKMVAAILEKTSFANQEYIFKIADISMVDKIVEMRKRLAAESKYVNPQNATQVRNNLQNLIAPDVLDLVIEYRNQLIGFCFSYAQVSASDPDTAHIAQIAVLKEHQGRGLATAMLSFTCSWAKDFIKKKHIHLSVDGDNANARKLYESFQFREIKKHTYYELGKKL